MSFGTVPLVYVFALGWNNSMENSLLVLVSCAVCRRFFEWTKVQKAFGNSVHFIYCSFYAGTFNRWIFLRHTVIKQTTSNRRKRETYLLKWWQDARRKNDIVFTLLNSQPNKQTFVYSFVHSVSQPFILPIFIIFVPILIGKWL